VKWWWFPLAGIAVVASTASLRDYVRLRDAVSNARVIAEDARRDAAQAREYARARSSCALHVCRERVTELARQVVIMAHTIPGRARLPSTFGQLTHWEDCNVGLD
jgi:hypothetical protein